MGKGLQVLYHYGRAKYRQRFQSRHHLESWQAHKLNQALERATQIFPFYRDLKGQPYESFPITNKKTLLNHFQDLNSLNIPLHMAMDLAIKSEQSRDFSPMIGDTAVGLSTGTSGSRAVFLVQRQERLRWAGTVLAKALPRPIWNKQRIAFLFRANNHLYSTVNSKRIDFRFFDLLQPLDNFLTSLEEFAPDILIGPARVLSQISSVANTYRLNPKHIISVAEVLEDDEKARIEAAFGIKVHQIYQATEGFLAASCPLGTLHLNEDLVYFERQYLDADQRRFVPIITDFFRESQGIIRYRLNDILIASNKPCACGSVMQPIEKIEGRCDDVIFLPSIKDQKLTPIFPDTLRTTIAKSDFRFDDFQILQTDKHQLTFRFDSQDPNIASVTSGLSELFKSLQVEPPEILLERGTRFDPNKKFRRIERQFQVSEDLL